MKGFSLLRLRGRGFMAMPFMTDVARLFVPGARRPWR